MKIVLGLGAAMIIMLGTCLTCCLAALPYVYAVVFLPLFVFDRAYSLYFLRQFGNQYNLVVDLAPLPPTGAFPVMMNEQQPPISPPPPPNQDTMP